MTSNEQQASWAQVAGGLMVLLAVVVLVPEEPFLTEPPLRLPAATAAPATSGSGVRPLPETTRALPLRRAPTERERALVKVEQHLLKAVDHMEAGRIDEAREMVAPFLALGWALPRTKAEVPATEWVDRTNELYEELTPALRRRVAYLHARLDPRPSGS